MAVHENLFSVTDTLANKPHHRQDTTPDWIFWRIIGINYHVLDAWVSMIAALIARIIDNHLHDSSNASFSYDVGIRRSLETADPDMGIHTVNSIP